MHEYKGALDAEGKRFAVVVARFNDAYTSRLVEGATDALARLGAAQEDVEVFWVPGSFELPGVARNAAHTGRFDAVICLGVLIRGATAHFDLVAGQAAAGIARVFPRTGVPCIFGVVTAENPEQAAERCGSKLGNRGWEAAQAAVEMVNLGEAFGGWAAEETMSFEDVEDSFEGGGGGGGEGVGRFEGGGEGAGGFGHVHAAGETTGAPAPAETR